MTRSKRCPGRRLFAQTSRPRRRPTRTVLDRRVMGPSLPPIAGPPAICCRCSVVSISSNWRVFRGGSINVRDVRELLDQIRQAMRDAIAAMACNWTLSRICSTLVINATILVATFSHLQTRLVFEIAPSSAAPRCSYLWSSDHEPPLKP